MSIGTNQILAKQVHLCHVAMIIAFPGKYSNEMKEFYSVLKMICRNYCHYWTIGLLVIYTAVDTKASSCDLGAQLKLVIFCSTSSVSASSLETK